MVEEKQQIFKEMDDDQINQEMKRIEAEEAVLKRKGLYIFDQIKNEHDLYKYEDVLMLWQNDKFLAELEREILTELEPDPGGVRRFLADFEPQIEDLDARWLLSFWRLDSGESMPETDSLMKEYQQVYSQDLLTNLEAMRKVPGIESVTQRRLRLWYQVVEREQIDVALESQRTSLRHAFTKYRLRLHKKSYTAREISARVLREEQEHELRLQAWRGLVHLSQEIEPGMRELFLRTNILWQDRGYKDAVTPKLQSIGISETILRQVIASIEVTSRSAVQSLLSEYEDLLGHEIEQWDWRFAAGKTVRSFEHFFDNTDGINYLKKTYEYLGINVDQLPIQFSGVSTSHDAICYEVRIPWDIILSHGPMSGYREYFGLFYALGRACYFIHIDGSLPYLFRRYAPLVLSEGLAILSSWLLWEPEWLEQFTNLSTSQIVEFAQHMKNYELLKLRFYAGRTQFEMDAYHVLAEDPEADLNEIYGQHMDTFLFMTSNGLSDWASEPRLLNPFPYFPSYILGLAVAANLREYLYEKDDSLFSPTFGELYRSELVRQGNSSSWLKRLQQLTSRALTPFPMRWSAI